MIHHPFIVTAIPFQTTQKLYLIMDFVNGGHLAVPPGSVRHRAYRFYIAEICCRGHLHSLNIMHPT